MSLLVLGGIEGCGKSTQIDLLAKWLEQIGYSVFLSKAFHEDSRITLKSYLSTWENHNAIMFLFQALHAHQYTEATKALEMGKIVLADRWDENYLAYHSNFGDLMLNADIRNNINNLAFNNLKPDLGIILKIEPTIANMRRKLRKREASIKNHSDEYYKTIQTSYIQIAEERKWKIIDGEEPINVIHEKIKAIVTTYLKHINKSNDTSKLNI